MEAISKGISSLINTYRNSKRGGKIAIGGTVLLFLCLCVSVPIGMFSGSPDEPVQKGVTQNDMMAIQETAVAAAWSVITQTALALPPEPTATLEPTITPMPTFTPMPLPTATLEQAIALPSNAASCVPTSTEREEGLVVGIIDGDIIDVTIGNQTYRVRYIGIDTPQNGDVGYWPAIGENQTLVYAKQIVLVKDVSDVDQFGHLLRYVFVGDTFVNYDLVRKGLAQASPNQSDSACTSYFSTVQNQAQSEQVGLWLPTPTVVVAIGGSGGSTGGSGGSSGGSSGTGSCSCSSDQYNCSDFGTHASAQACYTYCISIGRGDVHSLDSDSDGSACEGLP